MDDEGEAAAKGKSGPETEEFLRLILESAVDYAILSTDRNGVVTSWNAGAQRVLGYGEAEILGATADVIFTPEQRAADIPGEERRQALRFGRAEDDRWQLRKGGRRFWASGLMMPLADRARGFVKILRDRTDAHAAEVRRREEAERFRLLATNIPQLVFRCRASGERTWVSPQWAAFTGLSEADSLGWSWLAAIHPEDRAPTRQAWQAAARSREMQVEHRLRGGSTGQYRWYQTRARPLEVGDDPDGEPLLAAGDGQPPIAAEWVGTMTDVHDMHRLQERQQVVMAELQHRTRNLLAVTQAVAAQTLRTSASLHDFGREFDSRLRALGRVQGLMSRPDATVVTIADLVQAELWAHAAARSDADRITVQGEPVSIPAAAAQVLGLALHELATNALKYGALAQPAGHLEIAWTVERDGTARHLLLRWSESGVVMPAGAARRGYGRELIERALPYQLGASARLEFGGDGVRCAIRIALASEEEERQ